MTRPPQAHVEPAKTPLRQNSFGAGESPKFGAKVRALRRREGLSQVQLADKIGISPSYLNLIENNRRPLPANLLIKLAQLFSVDVHSFAAD
jgi:transcriptional regulator with XRE-family HTH domain